MNLSKVRLCSAAFSMAVLLSLPAWAVSQKEFMDICLKGDALKVAAALKDESVSVNKADAKGMTPLMMAAQAKGAAADPNKIELLSAAGANVNAANKDSMRVLMIAAQSTTNPEVISALVRAGADLEERSAKGFTPLCFAAAGNPNPEIVNVLVDLGADVNATENTGSTPFLLAARNGNAYPVLLALLEDGANPATPNSAKKTALSFIETSKKYSPEQIASLKERIQLGHTLKPMSAERFARLCSRGIEPRVRAFLEARTDPNEPFEGLTPLMYAARDNSHTGVISTLLKWGAKENARDDRGRTAMILAAQSSRTPRILTELLTQGARADYRDIEGKNALDYARTNPTYTAENLLLLTSILNSVNEAEERGARIEAERRNAISTPQEDSPKITVLYRKMTEDQAEILRLTTLTAELQKKADLAANTLKETQARITNDRTQVEQQQALITKLNESLAALKSEQQKDQAVNRDNIDKLTVLWRSEMQKNLKLVEEHTLNVQSMKKHIEDVESQLRTAEAAVQKLTSEKEQAEARYRKEKNEAEMDFQAVVAHLNEVHHNELEDVNTQLRAAEEKERIAQQYQAVAATQHRQEIIDLKSAQARALEETTLKYEQQMAQLKTQHEKELENARLLAEEQRASEVKKNAEQLSQQHKDELLHEQSQHALALVNQQKKFDEMLETRLTELTRQKDEEMNVRAAAAEQEASSLKKQFNETLEATHASLQRERENNLKLTAELDQLKKETQNEIQMLNEQIKTSDEQHQTQLRQKLAEQESQLRAAFEVEKARIETQHRQELLDTASKLEAQHAGKINKLKDDHRQQINDTVSQLQQNFEEAQAQSRREIKNALAAASQQDQAQREKNAATERAGIEQGRQEARQLLESAYAQSLRQAELRYEKLLKDQQLRQKNEYDAALEVLNSKHRQEMEQASAKAQIEQRDALAAQHAHDEQAALENRARIEEQWTAREKELVARHQQEMEQLRLANSQNSEELCAALKKEYEARTAALLAQKDAQHAAELQKLEAIQKSAMRSLEERYQTHNAQPKTFAQNSNP